MNYKNSRKYQNWITSYRKSAKIHFIKRYKERIGYDLSENTYDILNSALRHNDYEWLTMYNLRDSQKTYHMNSSHTKVWYKLTLLDSVYTKHDVWVLYDPRHKTLVTVLPGDVDPLVREYENEAIRFTKQFEEVYGGEKQTDDEGIIDQTLAISAG